MPPTDPPRRGGGGGPTKETLIRGLFRQEIGSLQPGPALGESAPDFTLKTNDGDRELTLSKLVGPKPVVLVFGNFTCGPFRSQAGNVEKLYRTYKDRAAFVMVYVREAHPTDGWSMASNDRVGVALPQPRTYEDRASVAQTCAKRLDLGFPMLVDTIDDAVGARYSGMPSRLYLIDRDGKVAYKSGRGPFGFKPAELEQSLVLLLQEGAPPRGDHARVPVPGDADAWKYLPEAERGAGQRLPWWARALARPLPRTTAAMLDLDRLHRARSPLGPVLRGKMRWVAADANRCDYGRAYAEAELRRAGLDEAAGGGGTRGRSEGPEAAARARRGRDRRARRPGGGARRDRPPAGAAPFTPVGGRSPRGGGPGPARQARVPGAAGGGDRRAPGRRGGAWTDDGWPCRSSCRMRFEPERHYDHFGLRVVAVRRRDGPGASTRRQVRRGRRDKSAATLSLPHDVIGLGAVIRCSPRNGRGRAGEPRG
jgi:hypothetical protein